MYSRTAMAAWSAAGLFASTNAVRLEVLSGWPELRTVLAVESIRSVHGTDKVESEIRYFLSSCRDDPVVLAAAIRALWSIENAVHWVLDVTFREDDSRVRHRTAARNLARDCRAIGGQATAATLGSALFAAKKRCPKLAPSVPL